MNFQEKFQKFCSMKVLVIVLESAENRPFLHDRCVETAHFLSLLCSTTRRLRREIANTEKKETAQYFSRST